MRVCIDNKNSADYLNIHRKRERERKRKRTGVLE
jgi:hypothetical protein